MQKTRQVRIKKKLDSIVMLIKSFTSLCLKFFHLLAESEILKNFLFIQIHLSESNWVSAKTELWWLVPFNASEQFVNDVHDQNSEWVIVV